MADRVALTFEDRAYSAAELDALTGGTAAALAARGVCPGSRVAIMSSNRPEFVVALRAIWSLGAAAVLLSPAWKRAEVDHALALTTPSHAVGDHPVLADLMPMLHLDEPVTADPDGAGRPVPPEDADALFVFSSGTTGMPKAVRHTHGALRTAVRHWRDALGLTAADRMQIMTPPSHILGLLNIVMALDTGTWIRLHRRFDIDRMLHHIQADRITIEMAVAPIALALAGHPGLESYDLSSLRYIMWCATPVTQSVADAVTARTGVGWIAAYGTTELPVIACNPLQGGRLDTVGRPVPGVQVRIVSLDTGAPVGPGEEGEVQARSASVMAGYLPDQPGAFVEGWYRTGDVGYLDTDGWLRLTDRAKDMVKVRGFQVAPAEVEAVLHEHPAVDDCAVFGVPSPDGEALVAAVTRRGEVSADELLALVGERLASYKRPSRVVFVPEIPRLPSGKVLRRVLKERHGCPSDG
ncbi:class I adenylate-forming enzyme family protein [Mycolicibacterium thermoresistibile]|jgi:acyl-CoA synthetase (AMP-forming)/AMP-acid ligase II|uniref:AMP-dependent synthetase and ligase n=2 Tax=Mycolicibacterium thermoresistibile TaxID=1797 RepID=G7CL32_MYCT3|nr:AMP-binding protein [Mycolicibacterium thermoresistibile]EHI11839.1 AMP-dependent synthetase and ligase [Mycolicibacterium thermoresistibile ATCC 19527]MCV7187946.1 AMP-binding protein [Mycolicibacterium thermoresistibile]GAT15246.1 AMP-dependent synthetase and ligase [Mycolicibacterium thermoresistibile]SNW19281.1 AMP-dependent synthetase and ligase [Mycolicibacterium thermoresistibile]